MKLIWLTLALSTLGFSQAQSSQQKLSNEQLLMGSKALFTKYLAAVAANDGKRLAELYHDQARISVTRQDTAGNTRLLEISGPVYKKLLLSIPLTEAPDRYSGATFNVVQGGIVQISSQRQSVSRGYTAPNQFFVQPDTSGRFWIVAEKGIQKVK